jgi:ATP-dependent Clp protease ATP-binding subunit ClpC
MMNKKLSFSHLLKFLTAHSQNTLGQAFKIAVNLKQKAVSPYILLYALSLEKGSIAAEILNRSALNQKNIEKFLLLTIFSGEKKPLVPINKVQITLEVKELMVKSFSLAMRFGHNYLGTEHLLMSFCHLYSRQLQNDFHLDKNLIDKISQQLGVVFDSNHKLPSLLKQLRQSQPGEMDSLLNNLPNANDNFNESGDNADADWEDNATPSIAPPPLMNNPDKVSYLDQFCVNLTSKTEQDKIDPVIGRANEVQRISQILCRRNKNNPVLLGDPGVGKTAIVEGLAKNILNGSAPAPLLNKKIYSLDLTSLISGTMYRGEFEGRIKKLLDEVKRKPNVILFIDELHNIIGAGSSSGSMDVANIIKPALARGQIRCIGATTYEEYKKHIEKDAALERRFQVVNVEEPSIADTMEILRGLKPFYENYHHIKITDDALESAVQLSVKYLTNKFLPDKALDLLDEAAASLKLQKNKNDYRENTLERSLEEAQEMKSRAIDEEAYSEALKIQEQENKYLQKLAELKETEKTIKFIGELHAKDIINTVAQQLNIPSNDVVLSDKKQLINLATKLKKQIIGQDEVIDAVAQTILKSKAGIANHERPLASFLFLGPSGTGKTELAKQIAKNLFLSDKALIRVDMAEFAESFNVSKLIGAPAGYVGFREENKLSDLVKKHPYSVVLFDEIEKAHPQIFHLLLSVLDEGYLTDATGKKINFRNTIIIFTSNLGSQEASQNLGFSGFNKNVDSDEQKLVYEQAAKRFFSQEFINRLDKILAFRSLSKKDLQQIAKNKLQHLQERLKQHSLELSSQNLAGEIASWALEKQQEARGIDFIIRENLENHLAKYLLEKPLNTEKNGKKIKIKLADKKFTFNAK